jgi:aryl-alcohol dehydrogenase-like predicted oxidoreductase
MRSFASLRLTRKSFLHLAGAALLARPASAQAGARMHTRKIPATGEPLPVVGCGTWQTFDVGPSPAERAPRAEVLKILFEAGGSVIDSSPMYGRSEQVVGDLLAAAGTRDKAFLATKVWTAGEAAGVRQMTASAAKLQGPIDLMQVHNLVDWRTHLRTLREWKQAGRIRYYGVTHYSASAYGDLETIMSAEPLDFVQLNYSLVEREAEHRLLPLAAERGVAVIVNRPFAEGALFRRVKGQTLPPWAADIGCRSWAQLFLKWIAAHPSVTCVIPATSRPEHLEDNMQAGAGPLPDATLRERIAGLIS